MAFLPRLAVAFEAQGASPVAVYEGGVHCSGVTGAASRNLAGHVRLCWVGCGAAQTRRQCPPRCSRTT